MFCNWVSVVLYESREHAEEAFVRFVAVAAIQPTASIGHQLLVVLKSLAQHGLLVQRFLLDKFSANLCVFAWSHYVLPYRRGLRIVAWEED